MRYSFAVRLDLTTDELYELQGVLKKKLAQEKLGVKIAEARIKEYAGKGSMNLDDILACELGAARTRVSVLSDLISGIADAFQAAYETDTARSSARRAPSRS